MKGKPIIVATRAFAIDSGGNAVASKLRKTSRAGYLTFAFGEGEPLK